MRQALEGLDGVNQVEVDVKNDLFRVTSIESVTTASLLQAVRNLGYAPTVITTGDFQASSEFVLDTDEIPQLIREAMALARKQNKPVILIDFSGDG